MKYLYWIKIERLFTLRQAQDERKVSNIFKSFVADCMDAGARAMQDNSMEGIGRVESGTETEKLPRACRIMNNL